MATQLHAALPLDPKAIHIWVELQSTLELCRFSNSREKNREHPRVAQIKDECFTVYPLWTAQLTVKKWEKDNKGHPWVEEVSVFARAYVSRIPNRTMPGSAFLMKKVEVVDSKNSPLNLSE